MNISATSPLVSVLLLLVSMSSIQASASLAKTIFPLVGPAGTTALRLLVASAILLVVMRPWKKAIPRSAWKVIAVFGLATASMNLCFYEALSRIPLGVAVGLEFTGPLTVAMLSSRRLVDFIWVILAAAGLAILLPLRQSADSIDPLGAVLALCSGVCWALYIIFGKKAGSSLDKSCVALAMLVGSCAIFPVGLASSGMDLFRPEILPLALILGIFSSALPYGVEIIALKNLPSRTFSILMLVILPLTACYLLRSQGLTQEREPYPFRKTLLISLPIALVLGVYDGFYGPGTGTFLLLLLTGVAHLPLNQAAGLTKAINLATNVAALTVFLRSGVSDLSLGLVAGCFGIAGNYLGSKLFVNKGAKWTKPLIVTVLVIFFCKVCYELVTGG